MSLLCVYFIHFAQESVSKQTDDVVTTWMVSDELNAMVEYIFFSAKTELFDTHMCKIHLCKILFYSKERLVKFER
jgi:beta-glucosidase/6-phospho-beta-glucosidase/beta-galactosidase